jgi:hypothetical protein
MFSIIATPVILPGEFHSWPFWSAVGFVVFVWVFMLLFYKK